uniref:Uncharacterized protein n=1 Tax=Arundo donax TaxID=35708 RepID=A0A0A9A313_ARUDO
MAYMTDLRRFSCTQCIRIQFPTLLLRLLSTLGLQSLLGKY